MSPGHSTETPIPSGARLSRNDSLRPRTANLAVVYAPPSYGSAVIPAIDDVLTMCPPLPCSRINGTKVFTTLTAPPRFTAIARSQSAKPGSATAPPPAIPALLHNTWRRPKAAIVASAALATDSRSVTSTSHELDVGAGELASRVGDVGLVDVADHHVHALRQQCLADAEADAACSPGDECRLARKVSHGADPSQAVVAHPRPKPLVRAQARHAGSTCPDPAGVHRRGSRIDLRRVACCSTAARRSPAARRRWRRAGCP